MYVHIEGDVRDLGTAQRTSRREALEMQGYIPLHIDRELVAVDASGELGQRRTDRTTRPELDIAFQLHR